MASRRMLLLGLCFLSASASAWAGEYHATTRAGRAVRVLVQASWHRDCSADTPPRIAVKRPPANGSIFLAPSNTTITHAEAGGEQCLGRPARGIGIYYRPQGGFRGTDGFSFEVSFPNGVVLTQNGSVVVR